MIEVRRTAEFAGWMADLADVRARARIVARIERIAYGLFGDAKPVGDGVRELRIDYGPGYRVYYVQRGKDVIVLLCGGDKRRQGADIKRALTLAKKV